MASRAPRTGSRVLHYQIADLLGCGGMGVVYKATDLRLHRTVALKFLPAWSAASDEDKRRFEREAIAASQLDHINIGAIHGFEDESGQRFLVMACCEGGSLRDRLARGRLEIREAISIAAAAAGGLAHAHARGIIHRDVKPSNLLFTGDGVLRIVDFGLARLADDVHLTQPGTVAGTVAYMSPEQATGGDVDHRTDIWSLGVVLYEMVYGRLPFRAAATPVLLHAIVHSAPEFPPGAPPALERVVRKALNKNRDRRQSSAAEFAAEVEAVAASLPTDVVTLDRTITLPAARSVAREPVRRRVLMAAVAIVLALATWLLGGKVMTPARVQTIAVTAIRPGPDDAALEQLGAGLARFLAESLAMVTRRDERVRVLAVPQPAATAGILRGSISSAGSQIRVKLEFGDAGGAGGSEVVEASAADPAALHSAALRSAARLLGLKLPSSADVVAALRARSPQAAQAYVAAVGYLERYDRANNLNLAIDQLKSVVETAPDFPLGHAALSRAYRQKNALTAQANWLELAAAAASRAAELEPGLAEVVIERGAVRTATGDRQGAVSDFARALALDPRSEAAVAGLASAYEGLGLPEKAEAALRRVIDAGSTSWDTHHLLGDLYYRRGRYREAADVYRRTAEIDSGNFVAWKNLGVMLGRLKRFPEAEQAYRRSLAIKANFAAFNNLASLYQRQQRYSEAAEMYNRALEHQPDNYSVWANLGSVYSMLPGSRERSDDAYRTAAGLCRGALKVRPDDAVLISSLASYLAFAGQRAEPLDLLRRALALAPTAVDVLMNVGETYEYLGFRREALEWLGKALELNYPVDIIEGSPVLQNLVKDGRWQELKRALRR